MFIVIILLFTSMLMTFGTFLTNKCNKEGWTLAFAIYSICLWIATFIVSSTWYSSGIKAKLINEQYQMNYTQEEIFWASDVIDVVMETKRQRIEVTGNVLGHGKP